MEKKEIELLATNRQLSCQMGFFPPPRSTFAGSLPDQTDSLFEHLLPETTEALTSRLA